MFIGALMAVIGLDVIAARYGDHMGGWSCSLYEVLGTVCYVPALLQIRLQNKGFKILSRVALGAGIVLLWFGAMAVLPYTGAGLILRIMFVAIFFCIAAATLRLRRVFSTEPSSQCGHASFPLCQENLRRMHHVVEAFVPCTASGQQFRDILLDRE